MNAALASGDTVHLRRVDLRYRAGDRVTVPQRRLDDLFLRAMEEVGGALRDRGLDPEQPICVRRLEVASRLRLGEPDRLKAAAWICAVADALAQAVAAGGPNVVRYRSRRQALADVVLSAAAADLTRAWAWSQLGLWSQGVTTDRAAVAAEALRVLAADPPAVVPVLIAAADAGCLGVLLDAGRDAHWTELARSAARAARPVRPAGPLGRESTGAAIARGFQGSRIAAVARARAGTLSPGKRRACAALALAESAPERGLASSPRQVEMAEALLQPADERPWAPRSPVRGEAAPAATRFGGLPLLLHLVRALDVPARAAADPRLGERGLREVLLRLGQALAPEMPGGDPAARAFAGLGPDAELPPSAPWDEREDAAVGALAGPIEVALAARLGAAAEDARAVLAEVLARSATVVADPGWLEIQFPLDGVSVELRRAGLDLHPNFLAFLGVVVRFVYV